MIDYTVLVKSILPKGRAWTPKPGGNYEKLLDGIGDIVKIISDKSTAVSFIRNPQKTTLLSDLERELGIVPSDTSTEQERRDILQQRKNNSIIDGNPNGLETILRQIDDNLRVYQNNPAVDPQPFIDQGFVLISKERGDTYSGTIPADNWPLVFFIGGAATYDGGGNITAIEEVVIPLDKETLATDPILSYKGLYTWAACILVVGTKNFIIDEEGNYIVDYDGNRLYAVD